MLRLNWKICKKEVLGEKVVAKYLLQVWVLGMKHHPSPPNPQLGPLIQIFLAKLVNVSKGPNSKVYGFLWTNNPLHFWSNL
jgi:hypothetical protein